ncbi:MAG: OmpA family protein, partial [Actinomycetes bacterium]
VSSTQYLALDDKCHLLVKSKKPIKSLSSARISGFLFGYDSYVLTDHAKKSLRGLVPFISGAKTITITGYTQTNLHSAQSRRANLILAKHRAQVTAAFLRSLGVKVRIVLVAAGPVNPVSTTHQARNRRVNILISYGK